MAGIKYKNIIDLHNVISPQSILIGDDNIYLFDKINNDEGRLYKYDTNWSNRVLVMETDDGECYFGRDGFIYVLCSGRTSTIDVYDKSGYRIKEMKLDCTIFAVDVDSYGNIFALVSQDDGIWVRMYNDEGKYVRTMHSRNMPLISAIYCEDGSIYAGGFSNSIPLRIERFNHLGYIEQEYELCSEDSGMIISKVLVQEDMIVVSLSGKSKDNVYLIDINSGEKKAVSTSGAGVQFVYDMQIRNKQLILLGSDRKAAVYEMAEDGEPSNVTSKSMDGKFAKKDRYGYLSYLIWLKNFSRDFLNLLVKAAAPITMLFLLYSELYLDKKGIKINAFERLRAFIILSNLTSVLCVIVKNITMTWRKRLRIDNMLDIYNSTDTVNRNAVFNSIFSGIISCLTLFSLLYKNGVSDLISYTTAVISGITLALVLYGLYLKFIDRFKLDMENMVFELLSFDAHDNEISNKIVDEVKRLKRLGIERYSIKVLAKKKTLRNTLKLIKTWSDLRKKITGDTGKLKNKDNYFIFELNLKNRDIKYSRISVIEDFICYINENINISSVIIEKPEENDIEKQA